MRVNRLVERVTWLGRDHQLLARRAARAKAQGRPITVLVPACFGVALEGPAGEAIWGRRHQLWFGAHFNRPVAAAHHRLLSEFELIPGVVGRDVFGGLVRYLTQVGHYDLGDDLFVFAYDWRQTLERCAQELAAFLDRLAGAGDVDIDLVAFSTGGVVTRTLLADGLPSRVGVRRVVYVGAPQRGSLSVFDYLHQGMEFVRTGRVFRDVDQVDGAWDMLPHPDEALFVDAAGQPLPDSLYDEATWHRYQVAPHRNPRLGEHLARARALALRLHEPANVAAHPPSWVIGDRHIATPARIVIEEGKLVLPTCACDYDGKRYPFAYAPGDGTVPAATLEGAPGLVDGPWWTTMASHQDIARSPGVRALVVEALIADAKAKPRLYPIRKPTGDGRKTALI